MIPPGQKKPKFWLISYRSKGARQLRDIMRIRRRTCTHLKSSTGRNVDLNGLSKAEKAKQLRYKKAVLDEFNLESIQTELCEIAEACDDIRYVCEGDEGTLISALDGDEEEAFELRMMFSELSAECERLQGCLSEAFIDGTFNDFLAGVSDGSGLRMVGYDSVEEDYYGLTSFEGQKGCAEAQKRLERLTKERLIQAGNQAFRIMICFLNVRYKYDYLRAAFDVIKGKNTALLDMVRDIEKLYDKFSGDDYPANVEAEKELDKVIEAIPERMWVE